ncbi:hypothetical protein D9M68_726300 [compost metagenome]
MKTWCSRCASPSITGWAEAAMRSRASRSRAMPRCAKRSRVWSSASFSSDSGYTGAFSRSLWGSRMLLRRSSTSWPRRITWRCMRSAVRSSKLRTPSCSASISARMAASGVRSSCAASASQARREASAVSRRCAMSLKVLPSSASSSEPWTATRVESRPRATSCAACVSASIGWNQRRASSHDSTSAKARPHSPVSAITPDCRARKARSASLSRPCIGASAR